MNRTFRFGLLATAAGLLAGAAHRWTTAGPWTVTLDAFLLVTLGMSIVFGLLSARLHTAEEGYVSLGDSFLAVGTIVALVEGIVFAGFGAYLGIAYAVAAVALTLFALKHDRQTAVAVTAVMSLFMMTWVMTDPAALLLGITPGALWVLAALAYISSLQSGESLVLE